MNFKALILKIFSLNMFLLGDYMPTEIEGKQHISCDFSVSEYYNKSNPLSYRFWYNKNDLSCLSVNVFH